MYTEENEFDYSAYLEDAENEEMGPKKPFNWGLILRILIILIIVALLIFVFFTLKNNFKKDEEDSSEKVDSTLVFNNNIALLKNVAEEYFFKQNNMPKEIKEVVNINVRELVDKNFIAEVLDYDSNVCGYNTSYISMTRNKNDYMLEIYLNCASNDEKRIYYYDLDFNCLTCNGENYVSKDDDPIEDTNPSDNTNSSDNDDNNINDDNTNDNNEPNVPTVPVCQEFGDWTTEFKNDPNLDMETRVLVKGYKEDITYGDWSEETTTPIVGSDTVEVATSTKEDTIITKTDWSSYSTKKPNKKEGREIKTKTESVPYYTKSCTNKTYTVLRSTWDNNALRCTTKGIGKVSCTYQKQVCNNVKKYNTIKYYKYQDTITETKNVTYYKSREINKNLIYTDYILEINMPDGYKKLDGSEIIQYRYRTKCVK